MVYILFAALFVQQMTASCYLEGKHVGRAHMYVDSYFELLYNAKLVLSSVNLHSESRSGEGRVVQAGLAFTVLQHGRTTCYRPYDQPSQRGGCVIQHVPEGGLPFKHDFIVLVL